jgi:hypothetical protein
MRQFDMSENSEPKAKETIVELDESATCEVCGRFGAFEIGERKLCADCCQTSGSCCAESEKDYAPEEHK